MSISASRILMPSPSLNPTTGGKSAGDSPQLARGGIPTAKEKGFKGFKRFLSGDSKTQTNNNNNTVNNIAAPKAKSKIGSLRAPKKGKGGKITNDQLPISPVSSNPPSSPVKWPQIAQVSGLPRLATRIPRATGSRIPSNSSSKGIPSPKSRPRRIPGPGSITSPPISKDFERPKDSPPLLVLRSTSRSGVRPFGGTTPRVSKHGQSSSLSSLPVSVSTISLNSSKTHLAPSNLKRSTSLSNNSSQTDIVESAEPKPLNLKLSPTAPVSTPPRLFLQLKNSVGVIPIPPKPKPIPIPGSGLDFDPQLNSDDALPFPTEPKSPDSSKSGFFTSRLRKLSRSKSQDNISKGAGTNESEFSYMKTKQEIDSPTTPNSPRGSVKSRSTRSSLVKRFFSNPSKPPPLRSPTLPKTSDGLLSEPSSPQPTGEESAVYDYPNDHALPMAPEEQKLEKGKGRAAQEDEFSGSDYTPTSDVGHSWKRGTFGEDQEPWNLELPSPASFSMSKEHSKVSTIGEIDNDADVESEVDEVEELGLDWTSAHHHTNSSGSKEIESFIPTKCSPPLTNSSHVPSSNVFTREDDEIILSGRSESGILEEPLRIPAVSLTPILEASSPDPDAPLNKSQLFTPGLDERLSLSDMEREIDRMAAELSLSGTPGKNPDGTGSLKPLDSEEEVSFDQYSATHSSAETPVSGKWNLGEVEQAYHRMKKLLGSPPSIAGSEMLGVSELSTPNSPLPPSPLLPQIIPEPEVKVKISEPNENDGNPTKDPMEHAFESAMRAVRGERSNQTTPTIHGTPTMTQHSFIRPDSFNSFYSHVSPSMSPVEPLQPLPVQDSAHAKENSTSTEKSSDDQASPSASSSTDHVDSTSRLSKLNYDRHYNKFEQRRRVSRSVSSKLNDIREQDSPQGSSGDGRATNGRLSPSLSRSHSRLSNAPMKSDAGKEIQKWMNMDDDNGRMSRGSLRSRSGRDSALSQMRDSFGDSKTGARKFTDLASSMGSEKQLSSLGSRDLVNPMSISGSGTWFPVTPDRLGHRRAASAQHIRNGSSMSIRSAMDNERNSSTSMNSIRNMDKLEIFFKYTATKADLDRAEMERDALMDALQETRVVLDDVRTQRDELESELELTCRIDSRSNTAPDFEHLLSQRTMWELRAREAREGSQSLREEIDRLHRELVNSKEREEELERENTFLLSKLSPEKPETAKPPSRIASRVSMNGQSMLPKGSTLSNKSLKSKTFTMSSRASSTASSYGRELPGTPTQDRIFLEHEAEPLRGRHTSATSVETTSISSLAEVQTEGSPILTQTFTPQETDTPIKVTKRLGLFNHLLVKSPLTPVSKVLQMERSRHDSFTGTSVASSDYGDHLPPRKDEWWNQKSHGHSRLGSISALDETDQQFLEDLSPPKVPS